MAKSTFSKLTGRRRLLQLVAVYCSIWLLVHSGSSLAEAEVVNQAQTADADSAQVDDFFLGLGAPRPGQRPSRQPATCAAGGGCPAEAHTPNEFTPSTAFGQPSQLGGPLRLAGIKHEAFWPSRALSHDTPMDVAAFLRDVDMMACRTLEYCEKPPKPEDRAVVLSTPKTVLLTETQVRNIVGPIQVTLSAACAGARAMIRRATYHREPPGHWEAPYLGEKQRSAMRGIYVLHLGNGAVNSNFVYLQDPRPQAGLLWPSWIEMGVSQAWELRMQRWLAYPSYIPTYTLPNADETLRLYISFEADILPNQLSVGDWRGAAERLVSSVGTYGVDQGGNAAQLIEYATVPVMRARVPTSLAGDVLNIALKLPGQAAEVFKSNKGGWQSESVVLESNEPALAQLRGVIYEAIFTMMQGNSSARSASAEEPAGLLQIDIHASWIGINRRGHFNSPHVHPDGTVSGVVYLSTGFSGQDKDKRSSTSLMLVDPRPLARQWHVRDFDMEGVTRLTVEAGDVVLFPAYLDHYVEPHQGDEPRVILSFNARVRWQSTSYGKLRYEIPRRHGGGLG